MDIFEAVILGAIGSLLAAVVAYFSSQFYQKHKLLREFAIIENLPGTWFGIRFTNLGKNKCVSLHQYDLVLSGNTIKGSRKELGVLGSQLEGEPALYSVEGKIHDGVLVLNEFGEETKEIATMLINNFSLKHHLRGSYASTSDFNGSPIASPIVVRKNQHPFVEQLVEYTEEFAWCAWTLQCANHKSLSHSKREDA